MFSKVFCTDVNMPFVLLYCSVCRLSGSMVNITVRVAFSDGTARGNLQETIRPFIKDNGS